MKRLAILLLLLATTTQAFVAQAHVHAGFAATVATSGGDEQQPASGEDGGCLLCQIAAHGPAALGSSHYTVLPAAPRHLVATRCDTPDPHALPRTHAWSSRGPPRG